MRKTLLGVLASCMFTVGGGAAAQVIADCNSILTIGDWQGAFQQSCIHGDKQFTLGATDLNATATTEFLEFGQTHVLNISGFDLSAAADAWSISYSILVIDPLEVISAMFAGANDVGGLGSLLTKDVTGDPGGAFQLTVVNGDDSAATARRLGLNATSLSISETFSVDAGADLASVSNSYRQTPVQLPEPDTLALLGLAALGLAAVRKTRR